jgi:hypothetical protein
MKKLTVKEQNFAELCVSLGNQTEAYRQAFKPKKSDAEWLRVNASQLAKKLRKHIDEYRSTGEIKYTPQPKQTKGYIYILHIKGFPYYKVGISMNVPSRKKAIQTLVPFEIDTIRTINVEGYKDIEKSIHEELKEFRFKGEWFECELDLINKIFDKYDT